MKCLKSSAVLAFLCMLVALCACSGGGGGDTAAPVNTTNTGGGGGGGGGTVIPDNSNIVTPIDFTITGLVTDVSGTPLPGAALSFQSALAGMVTVSSGPTGSYSLTVSSVDTRLTVSTTLATYAPQVSVINTQPSVTAYTLPITLYKMIKTNLTSTVTGTSGLASNLSSTVTVTAVGRQAIITVPAGAVSGIPPLSFRLVSYDPRTGPGILESTVGALQSGGMFYIEFVDGSGNPATVDPNANIQISLAPFTALSFPGAGSYQGWQINPQTGQWTQPTALAPPAAGMSLPISAPGFWNIDRDFQTACVKGKLVVGTASCSGGRLRADGPDGISSFANSGADGSFCVNGAQTVASTLVLGSAISGSPLNMPASAGDCSQPLTCTDIGTINATADKCAQVISQPTTTPASQCGATTVAGGDAAETHVVDLGKASGTFDFSYDTFTQPDQIIVTYQGTTLFDTGCVGAAGSLPLTYSGTATTVTVQVNPNCAGGTGTAWQFTVGCPI